MRRFWEQCSVLGPIYRLPDERLRQRGCCSHIEHYSGNSGRLHCLATPFIDTEESPRFGSTRFEGKMMLLPKDPDSGLLHEVVNPIASAQHVDEIPNKPVWHRWTEPLEDSDISLAQPKRDSLRIAFPGRPRSQPDNRTYKGYKNHGPEITKSRTGGDWNPKPASAGSTTFFSKNGGQSGVWCDWISIHAGLLLETPLEETFSFWIP
jgi:hypothetical protein